MDGILRVDPQQLISVSQTLGSDGTSVRNLMTQMIDLINGLSSVWTGDAATTYTRQFTGLQDDMEKINAKIQEHVSDLNDMATAYAQSEDASNQTAGGLKTDVIS
jgi:WXG100 family type VII secretion target